MAVSKSSESLFRAASNIRVAKSMASAGSCAHDERRGLRAREASYLGYVWHDRSIEMIWVLKQSQISVALHMLALQQIFRRRLLYTELCHSDVGNCSCRSRLDTL